MIFRSKHRSCKINQYHQEWIIESRFQYIIHRDSDDPAFISFKLDGTFPTLYWYKFNNIHRINGSGVTPALAGAPGRCYIYWSNK